MSNLETHEAEQAAITAAFEANERKTIKVWSVTTNDDSGTRTALQPSKQAADAMFARMTAASWEKHREGQPWPGDAQTAYDALCDTPGFFDFITVQEHGILPERYGPPPRFDYENACPDCGPTCSC